VIAQKQLSEKNRLKVFIVVVGMHFAFFAQAQKSKIDIKVEYSKSADIFELMDNVSNWWPGFTEVEYEKYWNKNIKSQPDDIQLFQKYISLREKYYNDPDQKEKNPLKNRNGFFSTSGLLASDPYAEAFYSSNTLEEAYGKLENKVLPAELEFVKKFYSHFQSRYEPLINEDEKAFEGSIALVKKVFDNDGIQEYFEKIVNFFNTKVNLRYRVLYTWWPPIERDNASPTGQFLIMRKNPSKHKDRNDSDIVAHEIIHTISTNQPLDQKKKLTDDFLEKCSIQDKLKKLVILEEPLAVAFGQLLFTEKFNPKHFSLSESLYNNPWINTFSRLIFLPLKSRFEKGENINQGFINEASSLCSDLKKVNDLFGK
jgi:hypothetical protein